MPRGIRANMKGMISSRPNDGRHKARKPGTSPPAKRINVAGQPAVSPIQGLLEAAAFAARKHGSQTRVDGQTPYFSHVARVTLILSHLFGVRDEEVLTAALLHDVIEDTATDYDEIHDLFGQRVADYVVLLTKNGMLPKKKRETEYEARLAEAPEDVKIAKMADLYDNLTDRVNTVKIQKTMGTAERLLAAFAPHLKSPTGRAAHEKVSHLLRTVQRVSSGGR